MNSTLFPYPFSGVANLYLLFIVESCIDGKGGESALNAYRIWSPDSVARSNITVISGEPHGTIKAPPPYLSG